MAVAPGGIGIAPAGIASSGIPEGIPAPPGPIWAICACIICMAAAISAFPPPMPPAIAAI